MNNRWVIVTGASSGIGRDTALLLARSGFSVLAGVRKDADAESLRQEAAGASLQLQTVTLDVTERAHIQDLAAKLPGMLGDGQLYALVNNAGVVVAGPAESVAAETWEHQYRTNLFGPIALTAAMIPFLRRSRGRIVNVSSIGGRCAVPFMSPYTSSKFAMEGWSDALRVELRRDGIEVVLVEPGAIATPLWAKGHQAGDRLESELPSPMRQRYASEIDAVRAMARKTEKIAIPPLKVAYAILQALTARKPRTRYLVGTDAKVQAALKWLLPDRWMDGLLAKAMGL